MHPVTPAGMLAGRANELALLDGLFNDLARGSGNAVLIEGEPGIGKTSLVRSALATAAQESRYGQQAGFQSTGQAAPPRTCSDLPGERLRNCNLVSTRCCRSSPAVMLARIQAGRRIRNGARHSGVLNTGARKLHLGRPHCSMGGEYSSTTAQLVRDRSANCLTSAVAACPSGVAQAASIDFQSSK